MKVSKWLLILACTIVCAAASGCSLFPPRAVYVPPGALVELAAPVTVDAWVTNKKTGERERRAVEAQAGWYIVRPRLQEFEDGK